MILSRFNGRICAIAELLAQFLYPPQCLNCREKLFARSPAFLCSDCEEKIAYIGEGACRICCAPPGKHAVLGDGCSNCQKWKLNFTRALAVAEYTDAARRIVHSFKFEGNRSLAGYIAGLMCDKIAGEDVAKKIDVIIPVPLHKKRLHERGYNQSALLAGEIGKRLELGVETNILKRIRYTSPQSTLGREQRMKNPLGAFAADKGVAQNILLVDDVLTTGTTVSECARVLRESGAKRIYVAVFAR